MGHDWTREEDALLGTATDWAIAVRLGVPREAVRARRRALGISSLFNTGPQSHEWPDEALALLGKMPDSEAARRLDVSCGAVAYRRRLLGIPAGGRAGRKATGWTGESEKLLGTMSDGQVGQLTGLPAPRIAQRRRALGIAAHSPPRPDSRLIPIDPAKIRACREALGVTRFALAGGNTALAAHLGMLEKGTVRSVKPETLGKLCKLLRCEPQDVTAECEMKNATC